MEFGKTTARHLGTTVFKNNINLSTNEISITFSGSGNFVYLPEYVTPTFKVFFYLFTGYIQIPTGLETNTLYYFRWNTGNTAVKLYLTKADLDNNNPFDFTTENTADFNRCMVATVDYKYTTFPCVEKAATDVEDMFCCPPLVPEYIPEYITLNTGSEDDSGNYYLNEYPILSGDYSPGLKYKSRNQAYVPITRVQANIYDGPILHGTYNDTYTLRWEITTELANEVGHPVGHKRNYVKLFISANFQNNPVYYYDSSGYAVLKYTQSISLVEIYASPWVLIANFSYTATCTLLGNNDTDYIYPSVPEYFGSPPVPYYYDTPAGLPIPHTVTLTPSANHTVFPATVRLVLKEAKFLTPETDLELGDLDVDLTFNESLGGFYSEVLTLYGIQGRLSLGGVSHMTKTTLDRYLGPGTQEPFPQQPEAFYCNDIETNRGPIRDRSPSGFVSTVSLVAGIGHGNAFYDSRWKSHAVVGPAPYFPLVSTYFSWTEKNGFMEVQFSQYASARKQRYVYNHTNKFITVGSLGIYLIQKPDFFRNTAFDVVSTHPDSYYSSIETLPAQPGTPPPPS